MSLMNMLATIFILIFFFNDTSTTEIYTLSLHDALPICEEEAFNKTLDRGIELFEREVARILGSAGLRSEEHTSELQSQFHLVCRLLLEKKKNSIMNKSLSPALNNSVLSLFLMTITTDIS